MSIVIRLQYLSLYAKAGDIRRFFSGLHIPDGGIHITGGKKGKAFIVFTSDEDARFAMRKDGCKIMDVRVKLYLSSHMELQYELDQIAEEVIGTQRNSPIQNCGDSRTPLKKKYIYCRQEFHSHFYSKEKSYSHRFPSPRIKCQSPRRSVSPRGFSRSSRELMSPRRFSGSFRRSLSPTKFFRSTRRSASPRRLSKPNYKLSSSHEQRSKSPRKRSIMFRERSDSPKRRSRSPTLSHSTAIQKSSPHHKQISPDPSQREVKSFCDKKNNNSQKIEEILGVEHHFKNDDKSLTKEPSNQEKQALFEKTIAEAISVTLNFKQQRTDVLQHSGSSVVNKQVESGGKQFSGPLVPNSESYKAEYNNYGFRQVSTQSENNFSMPDTFPTSGVHAPKSFIPQAQSHQHHLSLLPPTNVLPMVGLPQRNELLKSGLPAPSRYTSPLHFDNNPPAGMPLHLFIPYTYNYS